MSGGWKRAPPAGNRPLDGRVRPAVTDEAALATERPHDQVVKTFETLL